MRKVKEGKGRWGAEGMKKAMVIKEGDSHSSVVYKVFSPQGQATEGCERQKERSHMYTV